MLVWSFTCSAAASWSSARHDGEPLTEEQLEWQRRHTFVPRAAVLEPGEPRPPRLIGSFARCAGGGRHPRRHDGRGAQLTQAPTPRQCLEGCRCSRLPRPAGVRLRVSLGGIARAAGAATECLRRVQYWIIILRCHSNTYYSLVLLLYVFFVYVYSTFWEHGM